MPVRPIPAEHLLCNRYCKYCKEDLREYSAGYFYQSSHVDGQCAEQLAAQLEAAAQAAAQAAAHPIHACRHRTNVDTSCVQEMVSDDDEDDGAADGGTDEDEDFADAVGGIINTTLDILKM